MSSKFLIPAACGLLLSVPEPVQALESSLRPKVRPNVAQPQSADLGELSALILARSLRPQARPNVTDTKPVVQANVSNAKFDAWIRGFRGRALAQGIRPQIFDSAFRDASYDPDVISKDRNQAEFKTEIWDYLDNAASPPRIEDGKKALRQHRRTLDRIEQRYGVEAEIVVAVWGLESRYGSRKGSYPMINALATLAFDGRRGAFFEKQLIAALKILQSGDVQLADFKGSWAGAMGHTQFIPTSYQAYAVDFTGDGKRDIWSDDPADALASTAAYLKRFGWTKGQPWGVEVKVPRGFSGANVSRKVKRLPSAWAQLGVTDLKGRPVPNYGNAALLRPAGPQGVTFMIFDNFAVIEKYNNADAYVIGVGHLADRIGGGAAFQTPWPRGYVPLSFDEKKDLQRLLKRRGYGVEKIDGLIGPNTRSAIRDYQQSAGLDPNGFPSKEVLKSLKAR